MTAPRYGRLAPPWHTRPRVLVVDDVPLYSDWVVDVLHDMGCQCTVVTSGEAALATALAAQTDGRAYVYAIVDILMPDAQIEGIAAARALAHDYAITCLMFTSVEEVQIRIAAMLAGAAGYVVKDHPQSRALLANGMQAMLSGSPLPDPLAQITVSLEDERRAIARAQLIERRMTELTPQQQRVAARAAQGMTNKAIAAEMGLSVPTINSHMQEVLSRLGLTGRADLRQRTIYSDPA